MLSNHNVSSRKINLRSYWFAKPGTSRETSPVTLTSYKGNLPLAPQPGVSGLGGWVAESERKCTPLLWSHWLLHLPLLLSTVNANFLACSSPLYKSSITTGTE